MSLKMVESVMESMACVVVTGAASDIGLQLCARIAQGELLGETTPIHMVLVDHQAKHKQLKATASELGMCNNRLLLKTTCTSKLDQAFLMADYIFLVSGVQQITGYTRNDVICINAMEYKEVGMALGRIDLKPKAKIVVMAESPNIMISVIMFFAPNLPRNAISGLSRTEQNRAAAYISRKMDIATNKVRNLAVWGIRTENLMIAVRHAQVEINEETLPARDAIKDDFFLKFRFTEIMRGRVADVTKRLKSPPSLSVVSAALQHMRDWVIGTGDNFVSMIVISDGSYEVDKGIPFSFPVRVKDGEFEIVQGLDINFFEQEQLEVLVKEIQRERALVRAALGLEEEEGEEDIAPPPWSFGGREKIPCSVIGPLERERMNTFA